LGFSTGGFGEYRAGRYPLERGTCFSDPVDPFVEKKTTGPLRGSGVKRAGGWKRKSGNLFC